jgi:Tfp pilus assembly protein PilP
VCPVPDKPTGPLCEPLVAPQAGSGAPPAPAKMLADCDPGLYCLQVGTAFSCEPCHERDIIRHEFKDRDFALDQARDPFQSFVIVQAGVGQTNNTSKQEPHQTCKREDQFVALNYSFQDLKLVGIVSQGTQRKVLMMDSGNLGHIIKRGDCVGKEKAVVKDIGTGYITFVVEEDPDTKRPAQEFSVQLHPGGLEAEPPPQSAPPPVPPTTAPIVTPEKPEKSTPPAQPAPPPPPKVPVVLPKK